MTCPVVARKAVGSFLLPLLPLFPFFLCGCSLTIPWSYVDSKEVTLEQAMRDLTCGLKTLQNEHARIGLNTGAIVDQIEITLNLTASAKGDAGLVVEAKPTLPAAVGTLGIEYMDQIELLGSRGNTIKITLTGFGTAKLNEAGTKAALRRGFSYDLGTTYRSYRENPCEPVVFSREDLENAYRQ